MCWHTLSKLDTEMVHAPQPPSPQPSLVPVRPLARSQLSSVVSGPKSLPGLSSYSLLLTKKYSRELAVPAAAGATPAPFIIPACPWRGCCLCSVPRPTWSCSSALHGSLGRNRGRQSTFTLPRNLGTTLFSLLKFVFEGNKFWPKEGECWHKDAARWSGMCSS